MKVYDASGRLIVNSSLTSLAELDDIDDVSVASPADGQLIRWDATDSKWQKLAALTASDDGDIISLVSSLGFYAAKEAGNDIVIYSWSGSAYIQNLKATGGILNLTSAKLTNNMNANNKKITSLANPASAQDADTKAARDAAIAATKLDDLATPDDNTDLNASTSVHGLLKKLDNSATNFMNGQGNWATPAGAGAVDTSGTPVLNDIARFTDADTIEGRSYAELKADLDLEIGTDVLAEQTIGIADDDLVEVDGPAAGAPASGEYARWTANGIEGRQKSEVLTDLNVADGADVTGSSAPQAHASTHDSGGSDQVHSIADDDDDTKIQVEEGADEDKIRMDVAGVEAFILQDTGILDLPKQSRARVEKTNGQTIGTGAFTKILLNTEDYDEHNEFDSTTNYRFTASQAGYYSCSGNCVIHDLGDGKKYIVSIQKNGVNICLGRGIAGGIAHCGASAVTIVYMAANDYLELYMYHDQGGDRDISVNPGYNQFSVHKVS